MGLFLTNQEFWCFLMLSLGSFLEFITNSYRKRFKRCWSIHFNQRLKLQCSLILGKNHHLPRLYWNQDKQCHCNCFPCPILILCRKRSSPKFGKFLFCLHTNRFRLYINFQLSLVPVRYFFWTHCQNRLSLSLLSRSLSKQLPFCRSMPKLRALYFISF